MGGRIHILNTYDPYRDRTIFWDRLFSYGIMELAFLIIAGDLYCTISLEEVWGWSKSMDPLVGMFRDALLAHNFVDTCPDEMAPTWDNGRAGEAYVAKRLDRFLMHEQLVARLGDLQMEIIRNFLSGHRPITLLWKRSMVHLGMPFKFNRTWLDAPQFNTLVRDTWHYDGDIGSDTRQIRDSPRGSEKLGEEEKSVHEKRD